MKTSPGHRRRARRRTLKIAAATVVLAFAACARTESDRAETVPSGPDCITRVETHLVPDTAAPGGTQATPSRMLDTCHTH